MRSMKALGFVLLGLLGLSNGQITAPTVTATPSERRVGVRPNDLTIGFTVTTAVAANKDPKSITITSNQPVFVPGALAAGSPTTVSAVLGATLTACPLVRDGNNTVTNSLVLILPPNTANCFFSAAAVVSPFTLPAQWLLPNPAPTVPATQVQLTITATDNVNAVVAAPTNVASYTTLGQTIVTQPTFVSGPLGPQGAEQRLFGVTPNSFRAAPFITPTAADSTVTNKKIVYNANRAIFLTTLAASTPTTVAVQLFSGATACTLTRSTEAATLDRASNLLILNLPDTTTNCVFQANGTVQAFTLPQGWLRPNPSAGIIYIEVYTTNNGLDVVPPTSFSGLPLAAFMYSTIDFAPLICANVTKYFNAGTQISITGLTAAQRVAVYNSLTTTTICDFPQFRLAMIVLPTFEPVVLTLPSSTALLATLGWWNVPTGGARSIFSTYLPNATAFTSLGIPAPATTNTPTTVSVLPKQTMVIVGNTGAVGTSIFANLTQPITTVGTAATEPINLNLRKLIAVLTVSTFDAAGALVTPIVEIGLHSPVTPGLILAFNNQSSTFPWVSILDYGTVVYLGNNDYVIRVPAMTTMAIYSAITTEVVDEKHDALFALLVLLIIPVLCCLAALYAVYYFLFLKKKKTPQYIVGPNPVMEPMRMTVPAYFPGPYSMPMPGSPMYG